MKLSSIAGKEKAVKRLAKGWNVTADEVLLSRLTNYLGESSVKVIENPLKACTNSCTISSERNDNG